MDKKIHSVVMLTLLLVGMLTLAFNLQPVEADPETITVPDDYLTIQAAVDAADDGDTILVRAGTYTENVEVNKILAIESENGAEVTIVQAANPKDHIFDVTANYVNISGFAVRGANYHENGAYYVVAGVCLEDANYCNISSNNASNNNLGFILEYSFSNILTNNIASSIHSGIYLGYSSNNTVTKNNVSSNEYGYGIKLWHSSNNDINDNNVLSNEDQGIWLYHSSNNFVTSNNVSSNDKGIDLWNSDNNIVYVNSFLDNTNNAHSTQSTNTWNSPEEVTYTYSGKIYTNYLGNYWSDYPGVDEKSGPYQNETDGDGIGDTPYIIDENNQDNYPLMEPWAIAPSIPTTIDDLKTEIEKLGSEGEIENQGIATSLLAKLNVARKLIEKDKIDQAKNMLNAFINEVRAQSGKHITPEAAELLIESAEYILSHL